MVDCSEALESQYLTVDLVKASPSKTIVITDPGSYELTEHKEKKLTLGVSIDGKMKRWRPNKETLNNLANVWGRQTEQWTGKRIGLELQVILGKECVVGKPDDTKPPVNLFGTQVDY
jgi:hypothetical protein